MLGASYAILLIMGNIIFEDIGVLSRLKIILKTMQAKILGKSEWCK